MTALPTARSLIYPAPPSDATEPPVFAGTVTLTPRDRTVRIREFETDEGKAFVAEFPERTRLDAALDDGRLLQIRFVAAELMEVRGDLARIAWHIGALRMHCQVESDHLLTYHNDDLEVYLRQMGAEVTRRRGPFFPEILNDKVAVPAPGHGLAQPSPREIARPEAPAPDSAPETAPAAHNSDGPF